MPLTYIWLVFQKGVTAHLSGRRGASWRPSGSGCWCSCLSGWMGSSWCGAALWRRPLSCAAPPWSGGSTCEWQNSPEGISKLTRCRRNVWHVRRLTWCWSTLVSWAVWRENELPVAYTPITSPLLHDWGWCTLQHERTGKPMSIRNVSWYNWTLLPPSGDYSITPRARWKANCSCNDLHLCYR